MPLHVDGVHQVTGILEEFPIMRFAFRQCYLSVLMFASLYGREQALVTPTAYESMPDTQPRGQGSYCSNKRPDEPGTLYVAYGVEQVVNIIRIVGVPD
jgi:hypothetical protein